MIKRVQLIGQTKTAADLFLGKVREVTVNTTDKALRLHDGATVGGFEHARSDVSNVPAAGAVDGKMTVSQAADLATVKSDFAAHDGSTTGHPLVTVSLPGFLSAADKTKLDGIEALAKDDQTAAEILTLLLTVDGAGSGLDADLLDGLDQDAAATANTIMRRDAAGRSKVVTPAVAADIATKGYADSLQAFSTGVILPFGNTNAPTGWTKLLTHNNKALRIITGAVSSGGSASFTSVFGAGKSTDELVLTAAHLPIHSHAAGTLAADSAGAHTHMQQGNNAVSTLGTTGLASRDDNANTGNAGVTLSDGAHTHTISGSTGNIGSGTGHSHTIPLDLQFVDLILASKD